MTHDWRIPFDEFAAHLDAIFERIVRTRETVTVETDGDVLVTVQPTGPERHALDGDTGKTDEDHAAFLASAGSWKDVDTDRLIEDIYASRQSSRPPVEL